MPAPEIVHTLVQRFTENREAYRSGRYNEAQLRLEFLNPLFQALGWDVANARGYAPANREVITEDSLEIEGGAKAPDYCFRLGHTRKFFVEAKKPQVDIQYDIHPAYQLRRYAWNAHLPLSILSDFEEFAVYDCRGKPNPTDSAATARVLFFKYTDYIEKWDQIAAIFSHDAVWKGSFDQYAADTRGKKGTTEVDDAFLKDIEEWRLNLARNIALRNQCITDERQLNFAVQMTIDRVIFLRICEDRAIEPENTLLDLSKAPSIYPRLVELFRAADRKYNSGLFHFAQEKNQTSPTDTFTPTLTIDDKVLKDIIKSLYYPCPYIFKEIPVEILGQVYEQFLGKLIRLTPGHQAKVEEKPEVRKAGGVYYTPKYIVDYIVANTLGKLLEGKTPAEAARLKLVDPACGSGSFLLGAFQCLLDWHRQYYEAHDPESHARGKQPALCPAEGGGWKLTTSEKKRILTNTIHGVDIDPQAVEVTKLSLLLKVLEEESGQLSLGFERTLPDLARNIQCGNSLIGEDYFEGRLVVDEDERRRVNPFEWHAAFPHVFAQGGFDAVIGNPPYLNIDDVWGKGDIRLNAIKNLYPNIYNDKTDIYYYFLGKSITLSKGFVSFIVSRAFIEAYKANKLRKFIVENTNIFEIIDFRNYYVFQGVGVTTCIINMHLRKPKSGFNVFKFINENYQISNLDNIKNDPSIFQCIKSDQNNLGSNTWVFVNAQESTLNEKIDLMGEELGDILILGQGMQTGCNNVFGRKSIEEIQAWGLKPGQFFKRATNSDIKRYKITDRGEFIIYPQSFRKFEDFPQGLRNFLSNYEKELKQRAAYKRGDCLWWKYTWPLHSDLYNRKRIICPYLSSTNKFAIDENNEFISLTDTTVLFENNQKENLKYILGLLNSKLFTFRFRSISKLKSGGIYEYFWNTLSTLHIHRIDFSKDTEKIFHDSIVKLVDNIMHLNEKKALTPIDQGNLEREIAATDQRIDQLVYQLYGLTEEEIKIVEGN